MKASNGLSFELAVTPNKGLLRIDRWLKRL
jgi:hypothetical protein